MNWQNAVLGRTGREVGRLGMAASYGVPAKSVEEAFDRGVNYLYFGSMRKSGFAEALRNLRPKRDQITLVVQSYSRFAALVGPSLSMALRKIGYDYADLLLLGLWGNEPPGRILDACRKLRDSGRIKHIAMSTHQRPLIPKLAAADIDVFHVRYNAVHTGAEREVFPQLAALNGTRPGLVAFTATSWRQLLKSGKIPNGEKTPSATDCYRFVLSNPAIDVCMSGPADAVQARAALDALDHGPMSEDELAWMRRVGQAIYR
ncbi:MAG TPA: aldo/keto reductase [Bryobacteraceae bacterium]|nr:aldo/keto reductase [Bryobacteraceae bacterium]